MTQETGIFTLKPMGIIKIELKAGIYNTQDWKCRRELGIVVYKPRKYIEAGLTGAQQVG